jgi:hypothetical protein
MEMVERGVDRLALGCQISGFPAPYHEVTEVDPLWWNDSGGQGGQVGRTHLAIISTPVCSGQPVCPGAGAVGSGDAIRNTGK